MIELNIISLTNAITLVWFLNPKLIDIAFCALMISLFLTLSTIFV